MVPIFGYGEEVSSSAAVESSFKKLKTVTLKHIDLLTNIETFLENHIMSLKSSSILRAAKYHTSMLSPNCEKNYEEYNPHQISISFPSLKEMDEVATTNKTSTPAPVLKVHNEDEDYNIHQTSISSSDFEEASVDYNSEEMLFIPKSKCSLCNAGKVWCKEESI